MEIIRLKRKLVCNLSTVLRVCGVPSRKERTATRLVKVRHPMPRGGGKGLAVSPRLWGGFFSQCMCAAHTYGTRPAHFPQNTPLQAFIHLSTHYDKLTRAFYWYTFQVFKPFSCKNHSTHGPPNTSNDSIADLYKASLEISTHFFFTLNWKITKYNEKGDKNDKNVHILINYREKMSNLKGQNHVA